jgi:hypothetical protein
MSRWSSPIWRAKKLLLKWSAEGTPSNSADGEPEDKRVIRPYSDRLLWGLTW